MNKKTMFLGVFLIALGMLNTPVHALSVTEIETKCVFNSITLKDDCHTILDIEGLNAVSPFRTDLLVYLEEKTTVANKKLVSNIDFSEVKWDKDRVMISGSIELATSHYWGIKGLWNSTWWNSTFPFQIIFHVNSTVSSDLTNYTALIPFDAYSWESNGTLASNCSDLLFVYGIDNSSLSWDIDSTCIENRFWVRLPTLKADNTTFGYIYIGNSTGILYEDKQNAYDDNTLVIIHMNDNTTSSITDVRGVTGSKENTNEPQITTGKINHAQDFDGSNDDVDFGDIDGVEGIPEITVCVWVYPENEISGANAFVHKDWGGGGGSRVWSLFFTDSTEKAKFRVWGTGDAEGTCSIALDWDMWNYYCGTYNNSAHEPTVYKNGVSCGGGDNTMSGNINSGTDKVTIGEYYNDDTANFNGSIDEVRIHNVHRHDDWIKMDYDIVQFNSGLVWFEGVMEYNETGEPEPEPEPELNITKIEYYCDGDYFVTNTTYVLLNTSVYNYKLCSLGCDENNPIEILGDYCNLSILLQIIIAIIFIVGIAYVIRRLR